MRAAIIGANTLFVEGLRSVLVAHRVRVVASFKSPRDLSRIDGTARATILIDCETDGDVAAAADELARLRASKATTQVVVLAGQDSAELLRLARLGTANAIVRRDISADALIRLLTMIAADDMTILPLGLMARLSAPAAVAIETEGLPPGPSEEAPIMRTGRPLSERELDILRCLVNGEANKAIARRLDIAEATVKIHVKGVLRKISVSNRTQAAIWALKHLPAPANHSPLSPATKPCSDKWHDSVPITAILGASEAGCTAIAASSI